jgi:hypothetical protein
MLIWIQSQSQAESFFFPARQALTHNTLPNNEDTAGRVLLVVVQRALSQCLAKKEDGLMMVMVVMVVVMVVDK